MMNNNSVHNKKIAKNTMFLYLRMGLVLIVSLYTTRVVIEGLGVENYGIYNVVSGFVAMFAFLNSTLSNGVQRFYNYTIGKNNDHSICDVYNTAIQIQVIIAVVLVAILETFGLWYIHTHMVIPPDRLFAAQWIFQCSVLSLVLISLQIPYSAAIIAYERMDYYAYLSIFDVFAKLAIAFAIRYASADKLILYGSLHLIVSVICFILYYLYSKYHFKELRFDFKVHKTLFKPMLSFSGWNVFGTFAYMMKGQGLNMLLNVFFGPIVNAARGVSSMIMSAIQGFQSNIVIAFRPQLVQAYAKEDYNRVSVLFYSLSKVSFILLSILSLPIILEINYVLKIWLGDNVPDYTAPFTILILINMIISSLNTPVTQVVHASGKMKTYQICTSICICSILPVSWLFLKFGYDPIAVYWISLIITIINQIACLLVLKKIFIYSLRAYCKEVIIPCIKFCLFAPILPALITLVFQSSFYRLVLTGVVSIFMSIIVSYIFVLNSSERKMVWNFIKKK